MRWLTCDDRFALLISHVGLRENILSLSYNSKSTLHQILFGSRDALHPCDSDKVHKFNIKFLFNMRDNRSIAPWNPFRMSQSIPRFQVRGSFLEFWWMDWTCCFASDLLVDHLSKDGFRSDRSDHELVLFRLLLHLIKGTPGFWTSKFHCGERRVAPCLLDQLLHSHFWLLLYFVDQARPYF